MTSRSPEVEIQTEKRETPKVVNIMDALKKSMQAKGQAKARGSMRKHTGKAAAKGQVSSSRTLSAGVIVAFGPPMSVNTQPGLMTTQVMPRGARSIAGAHVHRGF